MYVYGGFRGSMMSSFLQYNLGKAICRFCTAITAFTATRQTMLKLQSYVSSGTKLFRIFDVSSEKFSKKRNQTFNLSPLFYGLISR